MSRCRIECSLGLVLTLTMPFTSLAAPPIQLSKARFLDKCKGAWAGQMVGVCYGAPYEFKQNGRIIEGELEPWKPERIEGAINQDDCYVEMTFLASLEKYGLEISFEQAGHAFADSQYPLWHANRLGRVNVRAGIMPPMSGHPLYNRHAADIDFQIEADLLGIICPGMPNESNRLCDVFGRIMNYGDGVYGGMFIAGMYTAAYLEGQSVAEILQAGLGCIPAESGYHQCISDAVRWHQENPTDWRATWRRIEDKWQDDSDCAKGDPFNIDARLNGAYVALGLLYGNGDLLKTMDIAVRCGQDTDCNASSAAGVLGCMKGFDALDKQWVDGLAAIEDTPFEYTNYSMKNLIPACLRTAEQIVHRAGGQVTEDTLLIPIQVPQPPSTLEQWIHQREDHAAAVSPHELRLWDPTVKWRLLACAPAGDPGYLGTELGRDDVLLLSPAADAPAAIAADIAVPQSADVQLVMETASRKKAGVLLRIFIDGNLAREDIVNTRGRWITESVDLSKHAGKTVEIRVEASLIDGRSERLLLARVKLK